MAAARATAASSTATERLSRGAERQLRVGDGGLVDTARPRPGILGLGVLFAGAALLGASLAVISWLPRRRLTVRQQADGARIVLRGERFDRSASELERLLQRLGASA